MAEELRDKLLRWKSTSNLDSELSLEMITLVEYLAVRVFTNYEPAEHQSFFVRLGKWLNNFSDEDSQKTLLQLVPHLLYLGRDEFNSLYRAAYGANIARWLVELESIELSSENYTDQLKNAYKKTWITPLTDSLRINSFLKINSSSGHKVRPDWRALSHLGCPDRISEYMKREGIERVAMVEDFVGTSTQSRDTIQFACQTFPHIQFMVCPLVVCLEGDVIFNRLASSISNLKYDPVLVLRENTALRCGSVAGEPNLFARIRELHREIATKIGYNIADIDGYGHCGSLTAMHTNCPDNSHTMLWEETDNWTPLFPRVRRPEW
jgi:hypothetical protein